MTSWSERALHDAELRAFVDAEVARAHVELHALRVENAHKDHVIGALQTKIAELERDREQKRTRR